MEDGTSIFLRSLLSADLGACSEGSPPLGKYLQDQAAGLRSVHVAECDGEFAGFVTLLWSSADPTFKEQGIPEISDLRVLSCFRRRGIGTALLDRVETEAAARSGVVGLTVGLHSGYGSAQRLYARRGYIPDGAGVVVEGKTVPEGATIRLDDDPVVTLRMTKTMPDAGTDDDGSV